MPSSTSASDDHVASARMGGVVILERERELASIDRLVGGAVDGDGGVLIIEGQAGLGKTTLLTSACERARSHGALALHARGEELESRSPWGIATQLFDAPLGWPGSERLLHGAAGLSRGLFDRALVPGGTRGGTFPFVHGLHWLTANLADRQPVLLAVDDVHWSDPESLHFLAYLARRIEGLRVSLLVAGRPGSSSDDWTASVARIATSGSVHRLRPLSVAAIGELVAAVLPEVPVDVRVAVADVVGGNPFLCRELLDAARAVGAADPWTVASIRRLRPEGIRRSVLLRLAELGDEVAKVATATAVLRDLAMPHLLGAVTGLDPEQVVGSLERLDAAGLLCAGPPAEFTHPVLREVVYEDLGATRRAHLHAEAARALHADGARVEEVAAHLSLAEPVSEDWAVQALRAAADIQFARGAPGRAAEFLRVALEVTPARSRVACLLALGSAEAAAGSSTAVERFGEALPLVPAGPEGAEIALRLGEALYGAGRHAEAAAAFDRGLGLQDGGPVDAVVEARLLAGLAAAGVLLGRRPERVRVKMADLLAALPDRPSLPDRVLLAFVAGEQALATDVPAERIVDLADRALGDGQLPPELGRVVLEPVTFALLTCDRFEQALAVLDVVVGQSRREGDVAAYVSLLAIRGACSLGRGRVAAALADATDAVRLVEEVPSANRSALALACHLLAVASLAGGDLATARRAVDVPDARQRWGPSPHYAWFLAAQGEVQLALGDPAGALASFRDAGELFTAAAGTGVFCPWRSGAARAAWSLGDHAAARTLAEDELTRARAFGAARATSVALRCLVRLTDDDDERIDLLREARALLSDSEADLEHAGVLVDLGAALRRVGQRRAAREPLREGMDAARRCGAGPLVERAAAELEASGASRPRLALTGADALTPSERRVAVMAAEGLSNPQIAQALFVTRKTVEVHLSSTYRKLGISSRGDLEAVLGA